MSDKYNSFELKASYGVGRNMGGQLLSQSFEGIDINAVADGLIDAFTQKESAVSDQDLNAAFEHITQIMQAKQAELSKEAAEARARSSLAGHSPEPGSPVATHHRISGTALHRQMQTPSVRVCSGRETGSSGFSHRRRSERQQGLGPMGLGHPYLKDLS